MATQIIFQNTPFGFNTIELGTLKIYTGKVRLKNIEYLGNTPYLNCKYHKGYCILSFEVIDRHLANHLYQVLGKLCKEVAQSKLDRKWSWINKQ